MAVGLNLRKKLETDREEIPEERQTDVVVGIAVPVVDIDRLVVAVADYDAVAIRVQGICPFSSFFTGNRALLLKRLCALFPEFYVGAAEVASPPRTGKKFNLYHFRALPYSIKYDIPANQAKDISQGQAVAGPILARYD